MVLINEKKYACATCIKGHRVSGCTHTERPLFEVKKKGRPATQCHFCRDKRKGGTTSGSVHTKCQCDDLKNQQPASIMLSADGAPVALPVAGPSVPAPATLETKKGQPGSTPTFPNGLRDVHEMAAAAQALSGLSEGSNQAAERKLSNLLNACNCATTGVCKCCGPKRARDYPPPWSATPSCHSEGGRNMHAQVTDSLIEMFKSNATTTTTPSDGANSGSSTPQQAANPSLNAIRSLNLAMTTTNFASPDNRRHPAHTSPHVHKTRLYSPYSTNGHTTPRHAAKPRSESMSSTGSLSAGWASSSTSGVSPRPPLTRIRPLTDMSKFLGAAFNEDGSIVTEISRSALGLPGIHAFDAVAMQGGAKVEQMEMDVDAPVAFPTNEDVVIGACTCGDGCECPGCATHGNPTTSSPHDHHDGCGDACKSCFDCAENVSIPSGVTSIKHLIQVAASKVPQNPPRSHAANELNAFDTRVLPPAANTSEDAARAFGLVQLLPLKCCNGRCQCPPGQCSCESECCGCCVRCLCDHDGDTHMAEGCSQEPDTSTVGGCCSSTSPTGPGPQTLSPTTDALSPITPNGGHAVPRQPSPVGAPSSCCSGGSGATDTPPAIVSPPAPAAAPAAPAPGVRRTASVSRAKEGGRRVSVSNGAGVARATSVSSKSASKALALPRSILPKPNSTRLALPRSNSGSSRQPSPVHRSSGSSQPSLNGSPVAGPTSARLAPPDPLALPESVGVGVAVGGLQVPVPGPGPVLGSDGTGLAVGVDDIANALAASDVDFMAYLNSLLTTSGAEGLGDPLGGDAGPSTSTSTSAGAGTGTSAAGVGTAPALDPGFSFATSLAVSSATSDLSLLDLAPTATAGQTPRAVDYEASMGDIQHLIASTLEQQGMMPRAEPEADYAFLLGMGGAAGGAAGAGASQQQHQQQHQLYDLSSLQAQQAAAAAAAAAAAGVQTSSEFYYPGFNADYLQVPQQLPGAPPSTGAASAPPSAQPPAPAPASTAPSVQPPDSNPDIIDLSKPLNPSDVDRILQALLMQQARQSATTEAMPAPAQVAAPVIQQQQPQQEASQSQQNQQQSAPSAPVPPAPLSASADASFDDYLFNPSMVPQGLDDNASREWLLKSGWAQDLLGPSGS